MSTTRFVVLAAASAHVAARAVSEKQRYPAAQALFGHSALAASGLDLALYEQFFNGTHGGTFVEMGAGDGRYFSNTHAFEKVLGWTGVLIEANPSMCPLMWRNRQCVPACLCTAISADYAPITMEKGKFTAGRVVCGVQLVTCVACNL